jgi:hypothetical protein
MKQQALTDAEFDRLSSVLEHFGNQRTMKVEQLDGFLAALVCSPDSVPPSSVAVADVSMRCRRWLASGVSDRKTGPTCGAHEALHHRRAGLSFSIASLSRCSA